MSVFIHFVVTIVADIWTRMRCWNVEMYIIYIYIVNDSDDDDDVVKVFLMFAFSKL